MLRRFSHFAIYLLLVLIPLQSIAAANMLVCNSMMTIDKVSEKSHMMPCHEDMNSTVSNNTHQKHDSDTSNNNKDACKANCASLAAMAAVSSYLKSTSL